MFSSATATWHTLQEQDFPRRTREKLSACCAKKFQKRVEQEGICKKSTNGQCSYRPFLICSEIEMHIIGGSLLCPMKIDLITRLTLQFNLQFNLGDLTSMDITQAGCNGCALLTSFLHRLMLGFDLSNMACVLCNGAPWPSEIQIKLNL